MSWFSRHSEASAGRIQQIFTAVQPSGRNSSEPIVTARQNSQSLNSSPSTHYIHPPHSESIHPPSSLCNDADSPVSPSEALPAQQDVLQTARLQWQRLLNGNSTSGPRPTGQASRRVLLSEDNSRTNDYWGDILEEKPNDCTRVYALNVNGLRLDGRGGKFDTLCRMLKEAQADVFCGQEHNLDTTQPRVRKIIFDTAAQHWERHRIALGTTPIQFERTYKPGGTMAITVGSLTGRVVNQVRDKWGRWVCQEYLGKTSNRLVIFSIYQPIVTTSDEGKITVTAQQRSLLLRAQDPLSDPRQAFRRDLVQALQSYYTSDTALLVLGDFNESLGSDIEGMTKIAGLFDLVDLMASRHSSSPPATYARGTRRLDYALASPHVCGALRKAGYDAFNERFHSDHRGYYFDFDTAILFGTNTQQLAPREPRGLKANNVKQVTEYIRRKHELLTNCNAFERVLKLHQCDNRHTYAEKLDKDMVAASLSAEAHVTRFGEPAWSVELAQARKRVSLASKQLSAIRTGMALPESFHHECATMEPPLILPTIYAECSSLLRRLKQEVVALVHSSLEKRDEERNRRIAGLEQSQAQGDKKMAQLLRRLKKAEDIKKLFRKIRHLRSTHVRRGVTRIEIPKHPDADP